MTKMTVWPGMSARMARLWRTIPHDYLSMLERARRREHNLTSEELYPSQGKRPGQRPFDRPLNSGNSRNSDQKD